MSASKTFHCIVDDTALITNIEEIEQWVQRGLVALIVPLHTLERLHLLKKDSSQIGTNARKAVKFLDEITSIGSMSHEPVLIQGPEDQYPTWQEVEQHYNEQQNSGTGLETPRVHGEDAEEKGAMSQSLDSAALPQLLHGKLNVDGHDKVPSPLSTPPLSPSSSGLLSPKPSPMVKSSAANRQDVSPVPPTLKALINPVVWYTYEAKGRDSRGDHIFLTNSSDTALIARDFGVNPKTIHQLRQAIGIEEQEMKHRNKHQKKRNSLPTAPKTDNEPKTLFRYEEASSEDEEVVFTPRTRGGRAHTPTRGTANQTTRPRSVHGHSPANSMSQPPVPKPQIPTEEIDPDSFDRGGFARGSTPLANVGSPNMNFGRGIHRGHPTPSGHRGGGHRGGHQRGGNGSRGRGRLFVP